MKPTIFTLLFFFSFNVLKAQNLSNDLSEMLTFFTGEFDNFQQIWKEKEDKINDSLRHEHIHSISRTLQLTMNTSLVDSVASMMTTDWERENGEDYRSLL